jgi:hypothetical protein
VAARIRKHHQDEVRARIQVSQIINVLERQALGEGEELSAARLKAIEILLRKSLPDLSAMEISGDQESPLRVEFGWKSAA